MQSRGIVTVVAVTVVVVAAGLAVLATAVRPSPPPQVRISPICSGTFGLVNVSYAGTQSGYLSTHYGIRFFMCFSSTVPAGSVMSLDLYLHSADLASSHSISILSVLAPYGLISSSPGAPFTIAAGGNLTVEVTFHVPTAAGTYDGPTAALTAV